MHRKTKYKYEILKTDMKPFKSQFSQISALMILYFFMVSLVQVYGENVFLLEQLNYIRGQAEIKVGRDSKIEAYEQFIQRAGNDPLAIEAMLDVAGIYNSIAIPELGIYQDFNKALSWYRKAVSASLIGTDTWINGQFSIVGLILHDQPDEARKILNKIKDEVPHDNVTMLKVENSFLSVCRVEGDLEAADIHARNILSWYHDPGRVPKEKTEKREADLVIAAAAESIITAWRQAPLSHIERADKINSLIRDHGIIKYVFSSGTEALAMIIDEIKAENQQIIDNKVRDLIDPYHIVQEKETDVNNFSNKPLLVRFDNSHQPENTKSNPLPKILAQPQQQERQSKTVFVVIFAIATILFMAIAILLYQRRERKHE